MNSAINFTVQLFFWPHDFKDPWLISKSYFMRKVTFGTKKSHPNVSFSIFDFLKTFIISACINSMHCTKLMKAFPTAESEIIVGKNMIIKIEFSCRLPPARPLTLGTLGRILKTKSWSWILSLKFFSWVKISLGSFCFKTTMNFALAVL